MNEPDDTKQWSEVVPPADYRRPLIERLGLLFLPKDLRAQAEEPNPVAAMLMPSLLRRFAWIIYVPWAVIIVLSILSHFMDDGIQNISMIIIVTVLHLVLYVTVPILPLALVVSMSLGELRKKGMLEGMMASGLSGRQIVRALLFPFFLRHISLLFLYFSSSFMATLVGVPGFLKEFNAVMGTGGGGGLPWVELGTLFVLLLFLLMMVLNFWVFVMLSGVVASRILCVKLIADPEEQTQRLWKDVAMPAIAGLLLLAICCCVGLFIVYFVLQKPWKRTAELLDWAGDAMPDWVDVRGGKPADFPYAWTSEFTPKPPIDQR